MKPAVAQANKCCYSILAAAFFLFFACTANVTVIYGQSSLAAQRPFDTINRIKSENRVDTASGIYKRNFRHVPERLAMGFLDQLTAVARKLDDKALESLVFDLKADYYAVNENFNNQSINYYKQALDFTRSNNLPLHHAVYLQHQGMFYCNFKLNTTACLYFLKAQEEFKIIGFNKVPNMSSYYSQVADFYYHLGDYNNAYAQLQEALKYKVSRLREKVSIINTMGLIKRNNHEYEKALVYFDAALDLARRTKDTVWIGITVGNIGSVYFMLGQYNKALPYIQVDYHQSIKYHEKNNATIALLRIVKINLAKNNTILGLKQLDTAEALINNSRTPVLNLKADIFDLKAQILEKMGLPAKALQFKKRYESAKDSLSVQNNVAAVDVVKMQYVIGKQLAEENRLKTKAKIEATERTTIFIVLFLILIILILVYSRQALRADKDRQLLLLEKRTVDDELKYTEMKLRTYTQHLRKNNALIDSFKQQIDLLKNRNTDIEVVTHLEELMQAHIMTDDNWMEFKKIFMKVYPNFLFEVKKNFLHLSETDIRLLTLIKLQCNNKEMANMLGITVEGIKKAKQRLRKKLNLDDDITIEEAIARF